MAADERAGGSVERVIAEQPADGRNDGSLVRYGRGLPEFLASHAPLAGIAALDSPGSNRTRCRRDGRSRRLGGDCGRAQERM